MVGLYIVRSTGVPTLWAILSDIHGNLEALESVLADATAQGAEQIAVLGDTIDYGPDPVACLERAHAAASDAPCVIHELADKRFAVNVGSVGQPRRLADNRASYVLYDGEDLEFRRVDYNWRATAAKISALPVDDEQKQELVERLETGV